MSLIFSFHSGQTQIISTLAGNGTPGFGGDLGPSAGAVLHSPWSTAVDSKGNIYIADQANGVVREVTISNGTIRTVAGNHTLGFSGDNGPAVNASFYWPSSVAFDTAGNMYIGDIHENRIRKVSAASGIVTTVAGNGTAGFSGDGGSATAAMLNSPNDLAVNTAGDIFIADQGNNRIRKITKATGVITTLAGGATAGFSGDNGPAVSALLNGPAGIALDPAGNIYIADQANNRIRIILAGSGTIATLAGNGQPGYSGDGGFAAAAKISPTGVATDAAGNMYIADFNDDCIRKITGFTGIAELESSHSFSIYPVPGDGNLTLVLKGTGYSLLTVTDMPGREVYAQYVNPEAEEQQINLLLTCSAGMYQVHLSGSALPLTKKILIRK